MSHRIKDRFTNMKKADGTPMSRQQIHMLRKRKRGICRDCQEKTVNGGSLCEVHLAVERERMRRVLGCKRRYKNAASYQINKKGNK